MRLGVARSPILWPLALGFKVKDMADNPKLKDAIEVLLEQLREQEREALETKKTINMLSRRMGEEMPFADIDDSQTSIGGAIRPDEYYGKQLLSAVQKIPR